MKVDKRVLVGDQNIVRGCEVGEEWVGVRRDKNFSNGYVSVTG